MSGKSVTSKKVWISAIFAVILVPAVILLSNCMGDRNYYIAGVLIIILAMIPFFAGFESCRPEARELVTIAVMCAIAVASRIVFIMLPGFKPVVAIIMITGMAFGPSAGFLTGAMGAFVSNFVFGQGPWTPWQMFAFGIAGFIFGLLSGKEPGESGSRTSVRFQRRKVTEENTAEAAGIAFRIFGDSRDSGTDTGYLHAVHDDDSCKRSIGCDGISRRAACEPDTRSGGIRDTVLPDGTDHGQAGQDKDKIRYDGEAGQSEVGI